MRVYVDSASDTGAALVTVTEVGYEKICAAVAARSAGLAFHWTQRQLKPTAVAYGTRNSEDRAGETMSLWPEPHARDYAHSTLYWEEVRQTY